MAVTSQCLSPESSEGSRGGIVALGVWLASLLGAIFFLHHEAAKYTRIFQDLGLELPAATVAALNISRMVVVHWVGAGALAVASIGAYAAAPGSRALRGVFLTLSVIAVVAGAAFWWTLQLPLR